MRNAITSFFRQYLFSDDHYPSSMVGLLVERVYLLQLSENLLEAAEKALGYLDQEGKEASALRSLNGKQRLRIIELKNDTQAEVLIDWSASGINLLLTMQETISILCRLCSHLDAVTTPEKSVPPMKLSKKDVLSELQPVSEVLKAINHARQIAELSEKICQTQQSLRPALMQMENAGNTIRALNEKLMRTSDQLCTLKKTLSLYATCASKEQVAIVGDIASSIYSAIALYNEEHTYIQFATTNTSRIVSPKNAVNAFRNARKAINGVKNTHFGNIAQLFKAVTQGRHNQRVLSKNAGKLKSIQHFLSLLTQPSESRTAHQPIDVTIGNDVWQALCYFNVQKKPHRVLHAAIQYESGNLNKGRYILFSACQRTLIPTCTTLTTTLRRIIYLKDSLREHEQNKALYHISTTRHRNPFVHFYEAKKQQNLPTMTLPPLTPNERLWLAYNALKEIVSKQPVTIPGFRYPMAYSQQFQVLSKVITHFGEQRSDGERLQASTEKAINDIHQRIERLEAIDTDNEIVCTQRQLHDKNKEQLKTLRRLFRLAVGAYASPVRITQGSRLPVWEHLLRRNDSFSKTRSDEVPMGKERF